MLVVALTDLKGDLDTEAPHLAALFGLSAYDVKARLGGPMPKVVAQVDEASAQPLAQAIRARGHGVLLCDPAAMVPASQMVRLHRFGFDPTAIWSTDRAAERLAWADVGVVIVALLRSAVARTVEEVEYQSSISRNPPSQTRHPVVKSENASNHSLFLFPHARALSRRPWVLEEASAQFIALGAQMQPTRRGNFFAMVNVIRRLCPNAIVDDRYVAGPLVSSGILQARGYDGAPAVVAAGQVEITLNILASLLMRENAGPYRG